MDVLSAYQPRATAPLDDIAVLLGLPGKMGHSGAEVWDQFQQGKLEDIRNYCETDVLNTYLVYLRYELMRGHLDAAGLKREEMLVRDMLKSANKSHLTRSWPHGRYARPDTVRRSCASAKKYPRRSAVAASETAEAYVESLNYDGSGVAHIDGKVTFIEDALPGETIRLRYLNRRRNFDTAKLVEILSPSPERVAPACSHFGTCGGCSLQHLQSRPSFAPSNRCWPDNCNISAMSAPNRGSRHSPVRPGVIAGARAWACARYLVKTACWSVFVNGAKVFSPTSTNARCSNRSWRRCYRRCVGSSRSFPARIAFPR